MARKYELNETHAKMCFDLVKDHCHAIKNWLASAVEHDQPERAQALVKQLRDYEELFKTLNVDAHKFIDGLKSEGE